MNNHQLDNASADYIEFLKKVLSGYFYDDSVWKVVDFRNQKPESIGRPLKFIYDCIEACILKKVERRSIVLMKKARFDSESRLQGKDFPSIGYTMIGHKRLDNIQFCVEDVIRNEVPGDLMETGVWRGGATILMRALLKEYAITGRKVWVADSFEGLPPPKDPDDGWDLSKVEFLKVSLDRVKSNFARFGLLDEQVEFVKGWFCDTLPGASIDKLAVLRLDGDMYSSTMDSLQGVYHKVSKGGYVIVDDYYSWQSCKRAVTDFLEMHSLKPKIMAVDWSGVYWKVD